MAFMVRPNWNSFFFATQGPMKITLASGSFSLMCRPIITIGDGVREIRSSISGCFFLMYPTKPGQQEEHSIPFSTSSSDSRSATISAPRATSATPLKPSFFNPATTWP